MSSTSDPVAQDYYVIDWDGIYWLRQLHTCSIVFIALSVLFVSLRFIGMRVAAGKRKAMKWGTDDALIIASLIFFLPLCILQISEFLLPTSKYARLPDHRVLMNL